MKTGFRYFFHRIVQFRFVSTLYTKIYHKLHYSMRIRLSLYTLIFEFITNIDISVSLQNEKKKHYYSLFLMYLLLQRK